MAGRSCLADKRSPAKPKKTSRRSRPLQDFPFLKRLFTNKSMAKDEQILLILVKPTILIEKEIEQKQFPLLTSKLGP